MNRTRENEAYGAHHCWHVSQRRMFAVKSGTISFSATIYSYLESKVSQTFSGTEILHGLATDAETRQRRSLTVLDLTRQYYFEFLADVGIEQAVEIKPVRSFLPTGQVRDFVPVEYETFGP